MMLTKTARQAAREGNGWKASAAFSVAVLAAGGAKAIREARIREGRLRAAIRRLKYRAEAGG